jgi:hypothetical protein
MKEMKEINQEEADEMTEREMDRIYKEHPELRYYQPDLYLTLEEQRQLTEIQVKKMKMLFGKKNRVGDIN